MIPESPKSAFNLSQTASEQHRKTVNSFEFQEASGRAMLQFIHTLPTAKNSDEAQASYWKLEGARSYLRTLLTLADPPDLPKESKSAKLDFNQNK